MKKLYVAALLACAGISPAQAAVITRNFTINAVFKDGGPVTSNQLQFGLTYDTADTDFINKPVDSYTSTSTSPAFATNGQPVLFRRNGDALIVDGTALGFNIASPDFEVVLSGAEQAISSFFVRYRLDASNFYRSNDTLSTLIETPTAGAVPEASTWAMLIVGMGAVGSSLRQRRRATVRFA